MALPLISFDYKLCPGVSASKNVGFTMKNDSSGAQGWGGIWGGFNRRIGALSSRMALPLISFDYKPCPGVCATKLGDWIAVIGLN